MLRESLFLCFLLFCSAFAIPIHTSDEAVIDTGRFDHLKGFCDHIPAIQSSERDQRVAKLQDSLDNQDSLDAVVIEYGSSLLYFTGVTWKKSERPFLFVTPRRDIGQPFYVVAQFEINLAVERIARDDATIFTWEEDQDWGALVVSKLNSMAGRSANSPLRLGVDRETRQFVNTRLAAASQSAVADAGAMVSAIRMVKSVHEVDIMRCGNELTKAAIRDVSKYFTEGMTESAGSSIMSEALTAGGLTSLFAIVLFGPNAAYPHGTGNGRTLQHGDLVLIDTGGSLHGYMSDVSRTFAFPDHTAVTQHQRDIWNLVHASQAAALAKLQQGVVAHDVDAAARSVVNNALHTSGYDVFTHRLGHGIGLDGHEDPYMVPGGADVLEPGMSFSVEPGVYIVDDLGVRLEDIVVVTEAGYEVLGVLSESLENPFGDL